MRHPKIVLPSLLVGASLLIPGAVGALSLNPQAPPETTQFAFLVGSHHCTTRQMQPDGSVEQGGEAEWNGRYILDGWAIEDEWIAPLPNGGRFHGINIRSFHPQRRKWDNRWLPSGTLEWKYFEAEKVGDTMVMIGGEGEDARGEFVDRNVFHDIGPRGFEWRKDRSWDDGATWVEGVAAISCRRRDG